MTEFRQFEVSDLEWIWLAHEQKPFIPKVSTRADLWEWANRTFPRYQDLLLVTHHRKPICFVAAYFDGWTYEPHVEFFPWVKKRCILEANVEFFSRLRALDTIGVVVVKSLSSTRNLFDHVCKYDCLNYVGMVVKGDYRGDEYIYSVAGNAKFPHAPTQSPTAGRL